MARRLKKKKRRAAKTRTVAPVAALQGRRFPSEDGYANRLSDVCDVYALADAALILPAKSGSIHLSGSLPPPDQPRVLAAWKEFGEIFSGWIDPDELRAWAPAKAREEGARVLLANPRGEATVRELVSTLGYSAEIPGQVCGYWIDRDDETPTDRPDYDPTGALLFGEEKEFALDLVQVDYRWVPLSVAAVYTYRHSSALSDGRKFWFVAFPQGAQRRVWQVQGLRELPPAEVSGKFGGEAASRARADRAAIMVQLVAER